MTFYEDLFKDFAKAGIQYLIVGGVAVVLHGFVRATADLDLMVALDDLITLKKKSGRPQDIQDIAGLEYISRNYNK
ncbi:MAG: hypothetical protein KCHDKBKB_02753 [Elusimicrobia bacterium]|nr:hypothetical protein [Elusimicrobiota bacterium]